MRIWSVADPGFDGRGGVNSHEQGLSLRVDDFTQNSMFCKLYTRYLVYKYLQGTFLTTAS